jgi:hypothetical protein
LEKTLAPQSEALKEQLSSLLPDIIRDCQARLYRRYSKANPLDAELQDTDQVVVKPIHHLPGLGEPKLTESTTIGLFDNIIPPNITDTSTTLLMQPTNDQKQLSYSEFEACDASSLDIWFENLNGAEDISNLSKWEPDGDLS